MISPELVDLMLHLTKCTLNPTPLWMLVLCYVALQEVFCEAASQITTSPHLLG